MAAHKSDDDDDDDDDDNDEDDDKDDADAGDDDDDDDEKVESKDEGTVSVCEREDKPHGDASLKRGKGEDGSFLVCPQMPLLDPAEEARERGARKNKKR